MTDLIAYIIVSILALVTAGACLASLRFYRQMRRRQRRILLEDALKFLLSSQEGTEPQKVTAERLAGNLEISRSRAFDLIERMERAGLARSHEHGVSLTEDGRKPALDILRAHRLLERYLADEAGVSLGRVHTLAERAEHSLSPEQLAQINEHLGRPHRDPHGDPIPAEDGSFKLLKRVPLTDWKLGLKGRVMHVEDEPPSAMKRILKAGIRPGTTLKIQSRQTNGLEVNVDRHRSSRIIPWALAALIQVREAEETAESAAASAPPADAREPAATAGMPSGPEQPATSQPHGAFHADSGSMAPHTVSLTELRPGEFAEVVALNPECRGMSRRRLLDFGFTPGARVQARQTNAFAATRAYALRGATIALRASQAAHIRVRRIEAA